MLGTVGLDTEKGGEGVTRLSKQAMEPTTYLIVTRASEYEVLLYLYLLSMADLA
jgi:hypothetical protein